MKKSILLIVLLFVAFTINAQFRSTEWGMSKETVKKLEKAVLLDESDEAIVYSGQIARLDCQIAYFFINDKLYRAGYLIVEEHSNDNDHIEDFNKLKEPLIKKYGEPDINKIHWKDTLFKSDPSSWGLAVSIGHLMYLCLWKTPDMQIALSLSGDNYDITHLLSYDSIKLSQEQQKSQEEETLDQL